jgi:hypothetical protein
MNSQSFSHSLSRRLGVLVVAGTCALAVSACGSGGGSGGGSKDNGVSAKTADDILAAAKAAADSKGTVHASGKHVESGDSVALDMRIDQTRDSAVGYIAINGDRVDIVRIGANIYVKSSPQFLTKQGATAAEAQLVGNKWLKTTTSNKDFADFKDFTSIDSFLEPQGDVTKGSKSTVDGQKVIALIDSKGTADEGTLFIATTGDPLPVEIVSGKDSSDALKFTDFGTAVTVTAPPGALDIDQLGG